MKTKLLLTIAGLLGGVLMATAPARACSDETLLHLDMAKQFYRQAALQYVTPETVEEVIAGAQLYEPPGADGLAGNRRRRRPLHLPGHRPAQRCGLHDKRRYGAGE